MSNLLKKIYSKILKKIFEKIYSKLESANHIFFKRNVFIKKIKLSASSKNFYKIYEVFNSKIYTDLSENVAVIKDKYLLPEISTQLNKNYLVSHTKNSILNIGVKNLVQKKIFGNTLSLIQGISAINNYGHWMLDILPKLCIAEKYYDLNKFDAIYLPNINKQFQIDSLKYFNVEEKQFIDGSKIKHLYSNKFTIPQHPYWKKNKYQMDTVSNIDPQIIKILRKKFIKKKLSHKKKIFIDRSDSIFYHHQIENYNEIIKFLKKNNFKIIKLTNYKFEDQISLFNNANLIVGAHGAGLTNCIFCRPGTKLIELTNKEFKCDVFKNISKINKMTYYKIRSSKKVPKDRLNPDIFVPINILSKLVT